MKRLTLFCILLFLLIGICFGEPSIYKDDSNGYEFAVPNGYENVTLNEERETINAKFINQQNDTILYGVYDLYSELATEEKSNTNRADLSFNTFTDEYIEEFASNMISEVPNIKIIKGQVEKINFLKAYKYNCVIVYNGQEFLGTYVFFLENGNMACFQFLSKNDLDDSIINEVTHSFTMTKQTTNASYKGLVKKIFGLSTIDSDALLYITIAISIITTWGIGIVPPLIIRKWIFKMPVSRMKAFVITVILYMAQLVFWSIWNASGTHSVLYLIALITYGILHNGYDFTKSSFKPVASSNNDSSTINSEYTIINNDEENNHSRNEGPVFKQSENGDINESEQEQYLTTDDSMCSIDSDCSEGSHEGTLKMERDEDSTLILCEKTGIQTKTKPTLEEKLSTLQVLLYKELITKEDYDKKKKELLDSL